MWFAQELAAGSSPSRTQGLRALKANVSRPLEVAFDYTMLGEKELAFQWLEKAYEEHGFGMTTLGLDRRFDSLHSDPRFQDLLRRVGLPL